jgi:hypothetical protein
MQWIGKLTARTADPQRAQAGLQKVGDVSENTVLQEAKRLTGYDFAGFLVGLASSGVPQDEAARIHARIVRESRDVVQVFASAKIRSHQRAAAAMSKLEQQLVCIDRYERRALSRRKAALRALAISQNDFRKARGAD